MFIYTLDAHPAVVTAGYELARCLRVMTGAEVRVEPRRQFDGQAAIYVSTGDVVNAVVRLPEVKDPHWDDAYRIVSVGESLIIAGVNPRSALTGAYAYLRALGAEWLWPGKDGEVLPRRQDIPLTGLDVTGVPANRHRGVCIEGSVAIEHVLDMVDWLPRVGLNAYFLQFQVSSEFWRRWYEHRLNPTWTDATQMTEDECLKLDEQVIAAVKERGLLLHRVGHGWTAAAIGLPTNGWVTFDKELTEEQSRLIAEVNGKREVWDKVPVNTELCYSNPEAREKLVGVILGYARARPDVDALHFWLSDGTNNQCECAECRKQSPSDWYVTLLNEITPQLKRIAPDMKLVFLAYTNTLWPPERVKLDLSNDNLIYMFAPISRCYAHRLSDPACGEARPLVRPEHNRISLPSANRDNFQLLRLWDRVRPDDSFTFDYQFMWIWREDYQTVHLADLMPQDIEDYASQGIGGLVNCCNQRIFYPNGWPFFVMARALWGTPPSVEDRERYFEYAYGNSAPLALRFLEGLTERSGAPIHGQSWWSAHDEERAKAVLGWLAEHEALFQAAVAKANTPTEKRSWELMAHYQRLLTMLWTAARAKLSGDKEQAVAKLDAAREFVMETEPETAPALDTFEMMMMLNGLREAWAR